MISVLADSSASGPLGGGERRVHAIRVSLDELLADARNQRKEYRAHVGYLSSRLSSPIVPISFTRR